MPYTEIAARVVKLWNDRLADDRPFLAWFEEWYGPDYPIAAGQPPRRPKNQGVVEPNTDFAECLANARSYASPHLIQFAQALDHGSAAALRGHLTADHEVLVVDVGCAAGILSLFTDRAGFAHYIGVDTNPWMRLLSRAVFETVMDELTGWEYDPDAPNPLLDGYGGYVERTQYAVAGQPQQGTKVTKVRTRQPSFGILDDIDAHDGWSNYVRRVSESTNLSDPGARRLTVLLVLNHLLFQLHGVPRTIMSVIDKCRGLAALSGVHPYLISIEPGTLYKPDQFGTQGLDRVLRERQLRAERYSVTGLSELLTGSSKGGAAVRLVSFGA